MIPLLHTVLHLYILCKDRSSVCMHRLCVYIQWVLYTHMYVYCVHMVVLYSVYIAYLWSVSVMRGLVVLPDNIKPQAIQTHLN